MKLTDRGAERCVNGAELDVHEDRNTHQMDQEKQAPILAERGMVAFTTRDWTTHNPAGTLAQLIAPVSEQTLLRALCKRGQALPARFDEITFTDDDGRLLDIFRS